MSITADEEIPELRAVNSKTLVAPNDTGFVHRLDFRIVYSESEPTFVEDLIVHAFHHDIPQSHLAGVLERNLGSGSV